VHVSVARPTRPHYAGIAFTIRLPQIDFLGATGARSCLSAGVAMNSPRVSVVIPVYNGAQHLPECLTSILSQTYQDWEAVVVNNCSQDKTGEIADDFVARDARFRVVHCTEFVSKSANYNRAIGFAAKAAEFVKIVEADNYLWSESLERMVQLASSDHEIGVVGSYYLQGPKLMGWGIPVQRVVLPGNEVRRDHLLTDIYYLGVPTTLLFRARALAEMVPCFRPGLFFDDIELCFRLLARWKFGYVHQVLAFVRDDNNGVFNSIRDFDFIPAYRYVLAMQFGREVLDPKELAAVRARRRKAYLRRLGHAAVAGRTREYWQFHKGVFHLIDEQLRFVALASPVLQTVIDMLLNPKSTIERLVRSKRRPE
jgi:glycosyltransferase involved in cell wall biosynthesis